MRRTRVNEERERVRTRTRERRYGLETPTSGPCVQSVMSLTVASCAPASQPELDLSLSLSVYLQCQCLACGTVGRRGLDREAARAPWTRWRTAAKNDGRQQLENASGKDLAGITAKGRKEGTRGRGTFVNGSNTSCSVCPSRSLPCSHLTAKPKGCLRFDLSESP